MTEVQAVFALVGRFDPDEVTQIVGVEPTKTWRRGEPRAAGTEITHDLDGWSLGTEAEEGHDLPQHVARVLARLTPQAAEIAALRGRLALEAHLTCVAYVTNQGPTLSFPQETLRQVLALGATIDVDVIWSAPREEEGPGCVLHARRGSVRRARRARRHVAPAAPGPA